MTDSAVAGESAAGNAGRVRVWDPLVRIFHWSLAGAFVAAWLTADELQPLHELAGYAVAALIALRVAWGLAGSRYARFSQFVRRPSAVLAYLGDMVRGRERRHLGHNPAGAAMIVALLITLSGAALTGWLLEDESRLAMLPDLPGIVAPASADGEGSAARGNRPERALEQVHETFANLLLLLVALHVGGVALASFRHRENLARAMVTGDKRAPAPGDVA